jgi:hypothetical protein
VMADLCMVLSPTPAATGIRLGFDEDDVGVVQPLGALFAVEVRPQAGHSFPMWTETGNISAMGLESSFSNFPNPFTPTRGPTSFVYYLRTDAEVTLSIWTALGERVITILNREARSPGLHQADRWDGRNGRGDGVVNGVYVAELVVQFQDGSSERILRKLAVAR